MHPCRRSPCRRRRIRCTSLAGATAAREVEPVMFAPTNGQWYLAGWCLLRDAMLWFVVPRIEQARMTTRACSGHTVQEVGTPPADAPPVHGRRCE
ncbi:MULTISPECIES: WYL domain-containing protein [unclassified Microbacterium]|uniref:WYL domain-containing protein n=1 Tax=Microbacterium sp. Se63.02b TaxID=2709304 RepID=UPI001FCF13FE|nr:MULTISPECIES: WYL domain-containing protein [unclassified Microbacterium]